ncbi:hypothetical protein [Vibrio phage J14]|nr:hypothetical protein [Vibrio phage J14]
MLSPKREFSNFLYPMIKANLKPRVRDLSVSSACTFNVSAVSFAPRAAVTGRC